jgi:hypothetical protein
MSKMFVTIMCVRSSPPRQLKVVEDGPGSQLLSNVVNEPLTVGRIRNLSHTPSLSQANRLHGLSRLDPAPERLVGDALRRQERSCAPACLQGWHAVAPAPSSE